MAFFPFESVWLHCGCGHRQHLGAQRPAAGQDLIRGAAVGDQGEALVQAAQVHQVFLPIFEWSASTTTRFEAAMIAENTPASSRL